MINVYYNICRRGSCSGQRRLGIQGDPFYLVYLVGQSQPALSYNGVECRMSPDLQVM